MGYEGLEELRTKKWLGKLRTVKTEGWAEGWAGRLVKIVSYTARKVIDPQNVCTYAGFTNLKIE